MDAIAPGTSFAPALPDADALLARLEREIEVSDELIDTGAGAVLTPRLTAWYGDAGASYTYSGITRVPQAWTPVLAEIRDRLNAELGTALNSCLVGVYDDGASNVAWHADDEPELRDRIVSVSLGASRTFLMRERTARRPVAVVLDHGSVLVMTVASQLDWEHAVPPEPAKGRRINLTFRVVAHG